MLKGRLPRKVHQALCQKIMKPGTSQDTKWIWLQVAQGPKREAMKLWGPGKKMINLVRQGALPKPRRNWRQGNTWRIWKVPEDTRSNREEAGAKLGRNGPRTVGPGWSAQPIPGPVRHPCDLDAIRTIYSPLAKSHTSIHSSSATEKQRS
jgi:hypothetical protein